MAQGWRAALDAMVAYFKYGTPITNPYTNPPGTGGPGGAGNTNTGQDDFNIALASLTHSLEDTRKKTDISGASQLALALAADAYEKMIENNSMALGDLEVSTADLEIGNKEYLDNLRYQSENMGDLEANTGLLNDESKYLAATIKATADGPIFDFSTALSTAAGLVGGMTLAGFWAALEDADPAFKDTVTGLKDAFFALLVPIADGLVPVLKDVSGFLHDHRVFFADVGNWLQNMKDALEALLYFYTAKWVVDMATHTAAIIANTYALYASNPALLAVATAAGSLTLAIAGLYAFQAVYNANQVGITHAEEELSKNLKWLGDSIRNVLDGAFGPGSVFAQLMKDLTDPLRALNSLLLDLSNGIHDLLQPIKDLVNAIKNLLGSVGGGGGGNGGIDVGPIHISYADGGTITPDRMMGYNPSTGAGLILAHAGETVVPRGSTSSTANNAFTFNINAMNPADMKTQMRAFFEELAMTGKFGVAMAGGR